MHSSALFLCTFFCIFHSYSLFMLHFFCVALFWCRTFFRVALFLCELFSCCTYFVLYTFRVLLVPCHTFFMLNSFHVVPFSCCIFLCVSLLSCCAFSRVASSCTLFMLHFLGIQASNFIKKRLHNRCFPVKFVKFLRAPILENICKRLLQQIFSETLSMSKSYSVQKQSSRGVL